MVTRHRSIIRTVRGSSITYGGWFPVGRPGAATRDDSNDGIAPGQFYEECGILRHRVTGVTGHSVTVPMFSASGAW